MLGIEGTLMVPPERNQILGRSPWKPRHVTVARKEVPSKGSMSSSGQQSTTSTGLGRSRTFSEDFYFTIYKSRDDADPYQQYPVAAITGCDIQLTAHRKQGSVLPTLVVIISDKSKKRRSSRAAGFMAGSKDSSSCSITLLFRTPLEGNHPPLQDWLNAIRSTRAAPSSTLESPVSPSFVNPFTTRSREASDTFGLRPRSKSGLHQQHQQHQQHHHQHKSSNYAHSSRGPPTFSSDSLSLRSRQSDVSSPSANDDPAAAYASASYRSPPNYTSILPGDSASSPPGPLSEYPGDFIGGWTSAQGRSLKVIREPGRGSVGSSGPQSPASEEPSSPAGPRETILDRAFQLRYIPGSESAVPGEEKLTSLARFEALMREVESRGQQSRESTWVTGGTTSAKPKVEQQEPDDEQQRRARPLQRPSRPPLPRPFPRPLQREEEEEDDDDDDDDDDDADDDDDNDEYVHGHNPMMPSTTTQRALDYVSSRRDSVNAPRIPGARAPVSFYHVSSSARPHTLTTTPLRPHTSHTRSRPSISNQPRSYSHVSSVPSSAPHPSPISMLPPPSSPQLPTEAARPATHNSGSRTTSNSMMDNGGASAAASKRLSFGEFTKRLSTTSNTLLVQTSTADASAHSNRSSILIDPTQTPSGAGSHLDTAANPNLPPRRWNGDDRCGWRNTVMSAPEGGFI